MATLPNAAYFNNSARTEGEFKQAQEDFLASVKQIPGAGVAELTNTISSGSITPAGSGGVVVVDTEAAAATDDLTNIVTTNYPAGSMILLRNSNAARLVVVKHLAGGSGQINLDGSGEYTLDDTKKWLLLTRRSADWHEVYRGPQRPSYVESPIINGAMEIWQRGTAIVSPVSGAYSADRWKREASNAGAITVNRSTNVPTFTQAGVAFNYSLEVDVTTADASVAVGDSETLCQRIEGHNWRHFAQRQFTLSFWVMSTKTGTHCVSLRNSGDDRSYVATYSIAITNTWEFKTITVPASPSAGTWDYATGTGLTVSWTLMAGSTYQTTAGAWQTGTFLSTSAQVNCMDSTSNFFRLTGVRMELGPIATPYSYVSIPDELARCKRYYQKSFSYGIAPVQNSGNGAGMFTFPSSVGASTGFVTTTSSLHVSMRAIPTYTFYNPSATNAQVRNVALSTDCTGTVIQNASEKHFSIVATTPASTAVGHQLAVHWAAEAEL